MTKTLRDLLEEAEYALSIYKTPDVSECQSRLNELLVAAGERHILDEWLTSLRIGTNIIYIRTSYGIRGCIQNNDYELPTYILEAADPVRAAKKWGLERRLDEAQSNLNAARAEMLDRKAEYDKVRDEWFDFIATEAGTKPAPEFPGPCNPGA